jgi:branched-chain amino acid transport system permease protein
MWMAVRDMDIAAELIGIRLLRAKLLAFAVSSFIIGVAGALMVFLWLGAAEAEAFNIDLSFQVLFIIIIGGLGSIVGAFFGAAVIHLMPITLRALPATLNLTISSQTIDQLTTMITGVLIVAFLIVEPHGLARLWQTVKQKLRVWPFRY